MSVAAMRMTKLLMDLGLMLLAVAALGTLPAQAQTTVRYLHTDALGSVVAKTDANGNVVERTTFEPYGAVVGDEVGDGPGYTGHVSDATTGLSYMQQRYYDPGGTVLVCGSGDRVWEPGGTAQPVSVCQEQSVSLY